MEILFIIYNKINVPGITVILLMYLFYVIHFFLFLFQLLHGIVSLKRNESHISRIQNFRNKEFDLHRWPWTSEEVVFSFVCFGWLISLFLWIHRICLDLELLSPIHSVISPFTDHIFLRLSEHLFLFVCELFLRNMADILLTLH